MDFGNFAGWVRRNGYKVAVVILVVLAVAVLNASWVTAFATIALAVGGLTEGYLYSRDAKRRNTLDVIMRTDSDPLLKEAGDSIRKRVDGKDGIRDYSVLDRREDRSNIARIMNHYETIALSACEGITDKSVIKEQFRSSIVFLVKTFVLGEETDKSKPASTYTREEAEEYFPNLLILYKELDSESGG